MCQGTEHRKDLCRESNQLAPSGMSARLIQKESDKEDKSGRRSRSGLDHEDEVEESEGEEPRVGKEVEDA